MYSGRLCLVLYAIVACRIYSINCQKELPKNFPRCYRNDPNLNACLLKATEQVKPSLRKGVPDLGFPPLSPFYIPEVTLQQGTNAVNYKAHLVNIEVLGLDNYKFRKFDFDVHKLQFDCIADVNQVYIKSNYTIEGKVLAVPIAGNGDLKINITTSSAIIKHQARLVTKNGLSYLEAASTTVKLNLGEVSPEFNGLFGGNEILAKATKEVIHDNLRELLEEIKPAIEEVLTRIVQDLLLKSVTRVPYDKLYPVRDSTT